MHERQAEKKVCKMQGWNPPPPPPPFTFQMDHPLMHLNNGLTLFLSGQTSKTNYSSFYLVMTSPEIVNKII